MTTGPDKAGPIGRGGQSINRGDVWSRRIAQVRDAAYAVWPLVTRAKPRGATVRDGSLRDTSRRGETLGWRAVLDAMPSAVLALDETGVVLHHNALVIELYPNVRPGQPISHVTRNPELIAAMDRIWTAAEPISVDLIERVPVERRVSATVSKLERRPEALTLPALLVTFRDLTEQDKLAQMRADFIANASHELRTPLASLRGFVETLQGPARDDPAARDRFLGIMSTQASRMTRLIDDLLSLSRAEMRAHVPPRGIVELNEVIGFVVQTLEPLAEGARITVTHNRLPTVGLIRGEREEIVQVLQNLLQNAIKYGREGGHVEIRVEREPGGVSRRERIAISIIDDGPGIAVEHLPRLTERFYRASVASSREKGGTGLGLAIVKHIVNRHRGDLKIQSKVGAGSTFTVVFDALVADRSQVILQKTHEFKNTTDIIS